MAGDRKSWAELKVAVSELRTQLAGLYTMVPSNITFRPLPDGGTRIYFLSNHFNGSEVPLLYSDVAAADTSSGGSIGRLQQQQLLESNFPAMSSTSRVSREEQLLWERKRYIPSLGITSYEIHPPSGKLIFPAASTLFQCVDGGHMNGPLFPTEVRINVPGAKLNPQICPSNPDLVAYVCNFDIYVTHCVTGHTQRLTHAHKNTNSLTDDPLSAGIPSYVIQEEFCRYQGYWWQPSATDGVYRIVYEEVDESEVKIYCSPSPQNNHGEVEEYRFPRAGTPNSKSNLKLVEFRVSRSLQIVERKELEMLTPLTMLSPWMEYLVRVGWTPDANYIWAQLLDRRQQRLELVLISVDYFVEAVDPSSPASFTSPSPASLPSPRSPPSPPSPPSPKSPSSNKVNYTRTRPMVHTLHTQESDLWINVNNVLYFFPQTDPNEIKFIWASEETGFRHLYLISAPLLGVTNGVEETLDAFPGRVPTVGSKVALTSGPWEVLGQQLYVDAQRELVYFLGVRENPLEKHLYVVSLKRPGEVRLLTRPGYSYTVDFNKDCTLLVTMYSNIQKLPSCEVLRISHRDWTVDGIHVTPIGYLLEPRSEYLNYTSFLGKEHSFTSSVCMPEGEFYCPELYTHQIKAGIALYAMVFKPHNFQPGQKYPTVLHIYGGPEVQVVSNSFKGMRQLRLHMLAAQGYCVVAIDSRGSHHRGLQFEGHLRCKMGTVELADQVEVLEWLSDTLGFIDMDRVAALGWSYGGYLSLMALAHYPHVFKVSVAGAPVTNWMLYDTGYTERYMDLPENNEDGYKSGSVLSYVNKFPDEENRLLIIHGLMDENVHFLHTSQLINALVKAGKPYSLQVYPNERHSLRHMDASRHYETVLLSFLQNYL